MKKAKAIVALTVLFSVLFAICNESTSFITSFYPQLSYGSKGEEVRSMQQRLQNWGYYKGNIDGDFGVETFDAVKSFQKKYNLLSNGIANEPTLIAMGLATMLKGGSVYAQGNGIGEEQLLARAINGEARGEPYEGQVAVGAVIINRTRDARFPKTIAGVIYQPGAFTAVSDGQINHPIDPSSTVVKAARDALNGWDPTNGCIYYWNPATATSSWIWSRQVVKVIGKHYFGK